MEASSPRRPRGRATSCLPCRRKKLRCNQDLPCSNCRRSKTAVCSYNPPHPPRVRIRSPAADQVQTGPATPSNQAREPTPASSLPRTRAVASPPTDYQQLPANGSSSWHESILGNLLVGQQATPPVESRDGDTTAANPVLVPRDGDEANPDNADDLHFLNRPNRPLDALNHLTGPIRAMSVKNRYISCSHWSWASALHPLYLKWLDHETRQCGNPSTPFQICKALKKRIRAKNSSLEAIPSHYGQFLPEKALADQLLSLYLRTFGSIYQVTHTPSLRKEHDRFFDKTTVLDTASVIRLQLCYAVGSAACDSTFSLRQQALRWIKEAEDWLAASQKKRSTLEGVQIQCLLCEARQVACTDIFGLHTWISAATLIPSAMSIGLHREPSKLPNVSPYQIQLRRRLWYACVELVLDACLSAGQPAPFSSDEWDCELMSSLNDDDIYPEMQTPPPPPRPTDPATDASVAIGIGRSIRTRISISKFCAKIHSEVRYAEALKLSHELMNERSVLRKSLDLWRNNNEIGEWRRVSRFHRDVCELIMARCLFALHIPFLPVHDPTYAYSRKVCLDTAIRVCYSVLPLSEVSDPALSALRDATVLPAQDPDLVRLCINGFGCFRSSVFLSGSIVAADLLRSIDTRETILTTHSIRGSEGRLLLEAALIWADRHLRAGQNDYKEYALFRIFIAEIEAHMTSQPVELVVSKRAAEGLNYVAALLSESLGSSTATTSDIEPPSTHDRVSLGEFWNWDLMDFGWVDLAPLE